MEKLKDELDKKVQSFLSLNFLMADFQGEVSRGDEQSTMDDSTNSSSKESEEPGNAAPDEREMYFCSTYHKYISRTFDISKCCKI